MADLKRLTDLLAEAERLREAIRAETRRLKEEVGFLPAGKPGRRSYRDSISPSEERVIKRLIKGESNKEIAHALHINVKTVRFHLVNIYRKENVTTRGELILKMKDRVLADRAHETKTQTEKKPQFDPNILPVGRRTA